MERTTVMGLSEKELLGKILQLKPQKLELEGGRKVQFVAVRELGGKLMVVFRDGLHERGQGAIAEEPEEAMVPLAKIVALFYRVL